MSHHSQQPAAISQPEERSHIKNGARECKKKLKATFFSFLVFPL
jgi:hypothetical protein